MPRGDALPHGTQVPVLIWRRLSSNPDIVSDCCVNLSGAVISLTLIFRASECIIAATYGLTDYQELVLLRVGSRTHRAGRATPRCQAMPAQIVEKNLRSFFG